MNAANVAYWRKAYETLVAQTGRDLNDGLGIDPRRKDWLPPLARPPQPDALPCYFDSLMAAERKIEQLLAEKAKQPDAPGWRDIATAPRDGTRILATGGGLDSEIEAVSYNASVGCWDTPLVVLDDRDDDSEGYNRPTHWQPLPPPPSADSLGGDVAKRSEPDALPGDLREKIAAIIVRKVLQEDYDDLVEGYLDEILMAADEIILLPAYRAVAETYYKKLSLIQSERGGA